MPPWQEHTCRVNWFGVHSIFPLEHLIHPVQQWAYNLIVQRCKSTRMCMGENWSRLNTTDNTNSITSCNPEWHHPYSNTSTSQLHMLLRQQYHASVHCLQWIHICTANKKCRGKNNLTTLTEKPLATRWYHGSHWKYECCGQLISNVNPRSMHMYQSLWLDTCMQIYIRTKQACYHHVRPLMGLGQHVSAHLWYNDQNISGGSACEWSAFVRSAWTQSSSKIRR